MTRTTLKKRLHETIDKVDNDELLAAVYSILNNSIAKSNQLTPMSLEAFYARNAQSQKEIKTGKLISHTEIKKRFEIKNK